MTGPVAGVISTTSALPSGDSAVATHDACPSTFNSHASIEPRELDPPGPPLCLFELRRIDSRPRATRATASTRTAATPTAIAASEARDEGAAAPADVLPDGGAIQHLRADDRGTAAGQAQILVAAELVGQFEPDLQFALDGRLSCRALEVATDVQRLDGTQFLFSAEGAARVGQERCPF